MGNMKPSIFTKIIRGDIPCHKIYEDEHTLAFLDIHPVQPGHVLVIPKQQVEFLWDLDEATYLAVMSTAQKVAKRLRETLNVPYVGEKVFGLDVPHAHVHLIPFSIPSEFRNRPSDGDPDHKALAAIAKTVAF